MKTIKQKLKSKKPKRKSKRYINKKVAKMTFGLLHSLGDLILLWLHSAGEYSLLTPHSFATPPLRV